VGQTELLTEVSNGWLQLAAEPASELLITSLFLTDLPLTCHMFSSTKLTAIEFIPLSSASRELCLWHIVRFVEVVYCEYKNFTRKHSEDRVLRLCFFVFVIGQRYEVARHKTIDGLSFPFVFKRNLEII
jgi:hypothetical protein